MDQDAPEQKEQWRERGEIPTTGLKDKIEGDLDKWVWEGMRDRRGCMGQTRWIQKQTLNKEKTGNSWRSLGGVNRCRKDHGFGRRMF